VTLDNALDIPFWQVRINQASATMRELVVKNFTRTSRTSTCVHILIITHS
jgi:hypothetical protein